MTDNITLPRAVVEQVREALKELDYASELYVNAIARAIRTELAAALAEPEQKPDAEREFATDALRRWANTDDGPPKTKWQGGYDAARRWVREVALPALAEPDAKPEPATREQVFAAYDRNDAIGFWNYCDAWREAERFHGITKEDKT